ARERRPPSSAVLRAAMSSVTRPVKPPKHRSGTPRSVIATSTKARRRIRSSTRSWPRDCWNPPAIPADSLSRGGSRTHRRCEALEPLQDLGIDAVAVDVNGDRMAASRQQLELHVRAAHQPSRDLARTPRVAGSVTFAVDDEHRSADLGKLIANHGAQPAELVDAPCGADAVTVQLLDRLGMPEIDIVSGTVPAHHALEQREQRRKRPAEPDGCCQRRHGANTQIV